MAYRRPLAFFLAAALLASQALATWSIVVVNVRTGEVAIASATCVENINLRQTIGIVAPEVGAGAAQATVASALTRMEIHDLMVLGVPPAEILDIISEGDTLWEARQFGLVDLQGRAAAFTGSLDGQFAGHVTGSFGDYVYSIQGNVITGLPVLTEAEAALISTPGDLAEKLMVAMEAAYAMGGDGRCSCSQFNPDGCGSPPPSFTKTAHVGFMLIARPGEEVNCNPWGCAGGDFYLAINEAFKDQNDPDPVVLLRQDYDAWRLSQAGRPDAYHSTVWPERAEVPADAAQVVSFVLDLADLDGNSVTTGGATITLVHDARGDGVATLHQVFDHGDGTYTVEVDTGTGAGMDLLRFVVDDGVHPVTLWPPTPLVRRAAPTAALEVGHAITGLDAVADPGAAFLQGDGLTAWLVGDVGNGRELLTATRTATNQPFGPATPVALGAFPTNAVQDLWVSADGLRMTFSAWDPTIHRHRLYETSRPDLLSPFDDPVLVVDLDSGAGDTAPFLSSDEMEIFFASQRDGSWDLWHARRLSPEARWFPPEKLDALSRDDRAEGSPLLEAGDTRLWFTRRDPNGREDVILVAERDDPTTWQAPRAASGIPAPGPLPLLLAVDDADGSLWMNRQDPLGAGRILTRHPRVPGALDADVHEVSAAAGGVVVLTLDAGPDFAGAAYRLVAGAPGATLTAGGAVLPVERDPLIARWLDDPANAANAVGFSGVLDAQGRATATWTLPPGDAVGTPLVGREFAFAFVAEDALGARFVGGPELVRLAP